MTTTYHRKSSTGQIEPQTSRTSVQHSTVVANRDIPLGKPSRSYFNSMPDQKLTKYHTNSPKTKGKEKYEMLVIATCVHMAKVVTQTLKKMNHTQDTYM
jgi:hypothetical protein